MSTQKLPTFRIKTYEPIGVELFFAFPEIQDNEKSFLEADVAVGASSLTANGVNFSSGDYLVLGQYGFEKTEIVKVSSATATTITLDGVTVFAHNRGELIQNIPYNQIVLERSTDGTTYTPLSAIDIRPDSLETYLQRSSDTATDYYKFRFYNSTTALYSGYSDVLTGAGYEDNSLHSIKKRALDDLGEEIGDLITDEFLNNSLREARRLVDQDPRVLRWSFRTKFNTDIGTIVPGTWKVAVPSDLRDKNTNKNILGIRVGKESRALEYQDNYEFRQNYEDIAHTTLNGAVVFGATSIVLTSSGDFEEEGSCIVAGSTVNVDSDTFDYTANDETTNTLSGVTGVPAAGYADGSDVWQNVSLGLPNYYTVDNGYIYFDVPFADEYDGENIYMDYYSELSELTNDNDEVDEPFYDMYTSYLKWKIKYKKANGKLDQTTDTDFIDWNNGITRLTTQEMTGQMIRFVPS